MFRPVPQPRGPATTAFVHRRFITVKWSYQGEYPLRAPYVGREENIELNVASGSARLNFRVMTWEPARQAAEALGAGEARYLGARVALGWWFTQPPPHPPVLMAGPEAVTQLIHIAEEDEARALLMALLHQVRNADPQAYIDPLGAALSTGLTLQQCRRLLFSLERQGRLEVYAEHFYRLNASSLPPAPVLSSPKPLPTPLFQHMTSNLLLADLLEQRWTEAEGLAGSNAPRMALIAYGAILEGALMAAALERPRLVNTQRATPKDTAGKPKPVAAWSLTELIQVAEQVGWLHPSRAQMGRDIRDFRNYIHPREELKRGVPIDLGTVQIGREVVWTCLNDLAQALHPASPVAPAAEVPSG